MERRRHLELVCIGLVVVCQIEVVSVAREYALFDESERSFEAIGPWIGSVEDCRIEHVDYVVEGILCDTWECDL